MDLVRLEGSRDELTPLPLDVLAHEVSIEERRGARGPRVSDRDETVVGTRNPDHDVGECEVRDELQVTDEHVQPIDIRLTAATLGDNEFTERRHDLQRSATLNYPAARLRRSARRGRVARSSAAIGSSTVSTKARMPARRPDRGAASRSVRPSRIAASLAR